MDYAIQVITSLGGTSEVARLLEASTSTVHSWKQNGIPPSRLAHLKLAAAAAGKLINWETGERLDHDAPYTAPQQCDEGGKIDDRSTPVTSAAA